MLVSGLGCKHAPAQPSSGGEIRLIDARELSAVREQHFGHLVFVNFWATWCEPCVEEFPAIVRAARIWRPRGVRFISVSADDPTDIGQVRQFLERFDANFDAVLIATGDIDSMIRKTDPQWTGSLPASFLYGRTGHRTASVIGKVNDSMLEGLFRPPAHKSSPAGR